MTKVANFGFALVFLFFGIFSLCQSAPIEHLMGNAMLVQKEIDCVLDKGPCDRIGNSLKDSLREILSNDCRHCNSQQITNAIKIINFMEKHHRSTWYEIILKYDENALERIQSFEKMDQ